jgi:hypothetical protein
MKAYNNLLEYRRLRIDAVGGALSMVMWVVIWVGAAISIGVALKALAGLATSASRACDEFECSSV